MARIRTIKPEFWSSPDTGDVSRDARLTFIGLWNEADDQGRLELVPAKLAATVFPFDHDVDPPTFCGWINELARQGLVRLYAKGRRAYLHITGWDDHQRIDHPSKPRCPDPDDCRQIDTVSPTIAADLSRNDDPDLPTLPLAEPSGESRETVAQPSRSERRNVGTSERRTVETDADDVGASPGDGFEEFWETYPRHDTSGKPGGGGSKAKSRKLWDKLDPDERAEALIGVVHYADFQGRDDAPFTCHATTWLNERRWETWQEPAAKARGPTGPRHVDTFDKTEEF